MPDTRQPGLLLVTGGAGFIGSQIVVQALADGWRLRVLDSLRPDVHPPTRGSSEQIDPSVEFIHADITDPQAVADALQGVTAVCHQAAKVGLGVDFADAPDYVATNELGTAVLLAAMARLGIHRLVLASSMVVYGEGSYTRSDLTSTEAAGTEAAGTEAASTEASSITIRPPARLVADLEAGRFDPIDPETGQPLLPALIYEDDPLDPRNVYASSKLSQEYLAASWSRTTGGHAIALRYHNVYGPGMPQNTPYAGVASLFRSAIERGEAPQVFEDGGQRRDFVHVVDVARANLAALARTASAESPGFRAYNVGSGKVHTIGDLAAALSRNSGGLAPVVTGQFRLGDVRHITASSDRLQVELGWVPSVEFEAGMTEFATAPLRAAVQPPAPEATATAQSEATAPETTAPETTAPEATAHASFDAHSARVDVIFPCLNEAAALPWVLGRLPEGYRAIVVDNGSTDGSADVARAHGALVITEPRRGFGSAAHAGLLAATAELVAFCDADASMDPAELPRLVTPILEGRADLVLGRRRPTARGSWPLHARVANRALSSLIRVRAGIHLHDLGPLRVARREQLLALGLEDRRSGYPLEMVLRSNAAGHTIIELDTSYSPRVGTSKVTGTVRGTISAISDMSALLAQVKKPR